MSLDRLFAKLDEEEEERNKKDDDASELSLCDSIKTILNEDIDKEEMIKKLMTLLKKGDDDRKTTSGLQFSIKIITDELMDMFNNPKKEHAYVFGTFDEKKSLKRKREGDDEEEEEEEEEEDDEEEQVLQKPKVRILIDSHDSRLFEYFKGFPFAKMTTIYPGDTHITVDDTIININERKGSDLISGITNGQFKQERHGQTVHPLPNCQHDIIWEADGTKLKNEGDPGWDRAKPKMGFDHKNWKYGIQAVTLCKAMSKWKHVEGFNNRPTSSMQNTALVLMCDLWTLIRHGSRFYSRISGRTQPQNTDIPYACPPRRIGDAKLEKEQEKEMNPYACGVMEKDGGDFEKFWVNLKKSQQFSPSDRVKTPQSQFKCSLLMINKMSAPVAEVLSTKYKSPRQFIKVLENWGPFQGWKNLANIKYQPKPTSKERRLGPELAKRIYETFMDEKPHVPESKKRNPAKKKKVSSSKKK